jgi:hypothetical protein
MTDHAEKFTMPASALAALAKAVPTSVVQDIVEDHYRRAVPTPPAQKSIVDTLLEKFGPEAD